jgi:hypothetical protein
MAFASYRTKVPDGSAWNLMKIVLQHTAAERISYFTHNCDPFSSMPAMSRATPNGRLIIASSSCVDSPNRSAKSQTACVTLDTLISSSYVNAWFCQVPMSASLSLASEMERFTHLTCYSCVLNHCPSISSESTHCAAKMRIYLHNLLY